MTPSNTLATLCVVLLYAAAPLAAQSVRGSVGERATGEPVRGGFVMLLGEDSTEIARTLTDAVGRFSLRGPRPGRYRLKAVAVGRASWESQLFELAAGEERAIEVTMSLLPVALPALVVRADRRCRVRPGAGVVAGELWEEARKALEAIAWTEREGTLRHRIVRYERERDARSLEIRRHEESALEGVYRGSSFVTAAPQVLADSGYVRENADGSWIYEAPDARVLLSDAWADLHCLAVEQPARQRPGLVGLTFEPVRGRDLVDIGGVMWLDAETAELRHLEFRYRGLPWEIDATNIGGQVTFRRLPHGPWIVETWFIRMPILGYRQRAPIADWHRGADVVLIDILEQGGWVEEVRSLSGASVWHAPEARLEGVVVDEASGSPVPEATVHLLGTDRFATTDERGAFVLDSLASGRQYLVISHPARDPARAVQPPFATTLNRGDTLRIDLVLRPSETVVAALCPSLPADSGVVAGLVREGATGSPVPGASIETAWSAWRRSAGGLREERFGVGRQSDGGGYYYVCGMPLDAAVTIRVLVDGVSLESDSVVVGATRTRRRDFLVPATMRPPR